MDNNTAWRVAFRLGWPSLWLTMVYGAAVLVPFALLIMFSGERNLPFAFAIFFLVLGTLLWKCINRYLDELKAGAPEVYKNMILPLLLGKPVTEERLQSGKAQRKACWEMVRERFTAFSLAALMGSVIVSGTKQPYFALLYLPLWALADVYFIKQLLQRKQKKPAAIDAGPAMIAQFLAFNRWKGGGAVQVFKVAVLWPLALAALLWVALPMLAGAVTFAQPDEIAGFFHEEQKEPPAAENGVYAILGLGRSGKDLHETGLRIADDLKKGVVVPPLTIRADLPACRKDATEACTPLRDIKDVLAANKDLLDAYDSIYRYEIFVWPKNLVSAAGLAYEEAYLGGFTDLGFLKMLSYVHKAYSGAPEAALKEWLYHMAFLRKLLAGRQSLEAYAQHRYLYTEVVSVLPYILSKDTALARKYHDAIRAAFIYTGPLDIDMPAVIQNEARLMSWAAERQVSTVFHDMLLLSPERAPPLLRRVTHIAFGGTDTVLQGKLYWLMREMEQLVGQERSDIKGIHGRLERIDKRYTTRNGRLLHGIADLTKPHIAAVANTILGSLPEYFGRVLFNVLDYNRSRMAVNYSDALAARMPPEKMAEFLKGEERLKEVVSGEPFMWDEASARICYDEAPLEDPSENQLVHNKPVTHCLETKPFVE